VLIKTLLLKETDRIVYLFILEVDFSRIDLSLQKACGCIWRVRSGG